MSHEIVKAASGIVYKAKFTDDPLLIFVITASCFLFLNLNFF